MKIKRWDCQNSVNMEKRSQLNESLFSTLMSVIFLHETRSITRRNPLWLLLFMLQKHSETFRDPNMLSDTKNMIGPFVSNLSCLKKQLSF